MHYLVTGGAGFIGSIISKNLLAVLVVNKKIGIKARNNKQNNKNFSPSNFPKFAPQLIQIFSLSTCFESHLEHFTFIKYFNS